MTPLETIQGYCDQVEREHQDRDGMCQGLNCRPGTAPWPCEAVILSRSLRLAVGFIAAHLTDVPLAGLPAEIRAT